MACSKNDKKASVDRASGTKGGEEEMKLEIKVGDPSMQGFKEAWTLCK